MRKILWFILGAFLFCALGQFAYGQDFENLPDEVKGKITLENSSRVAYGAIYIKLLRTAVKPGKITYWVTVHKNTDQILSCGYVTVGVPNSCRHWIYQRNVWQVSDCQGEIDWIKENDVPRKGV